MPMSEAARSDLYTGLVEVLGRTRAETLMASLPTFEPTDVATKGDVDRLRVELRGEMRELRDELRGDMERLRVGFREEMGTLRTELRDEFRGEMGELGARFTIIEHRLDRLFLALVGGLFVVVAAMVGVVVAGL